MKALMSVNVLTCVSSVLLVFVSSVPVPRTREEAIEQTKRECQRDYRLYFDHGTENCEQCREICVHAEIMGTQTQCQENCAKYQEAMKCVEGEDSFFDEGLSVCSHCSLLCENHEHKKTTDECEKMCSAYLAKQTPEQVPSHLKENSLKAIQGEGGSSDSSSPMLHPGWIATIVVGCVAAICTTLVAIVLVRACSSQYTEAPQTDGEGEGHNRSRKPVEETNRHSDSAHFAIPGTENPVATTQAFSDLPDSGSRSQDSQRPVIT